MRVYPAGFVYYNCECGAHFLIDNSQVCVIDVLRLIFHGYVNALSAIKSLGAAPNRKSLLGHLDRAVIGYNRQILADRFELLHLIRLLNRGMMTTNRKDYEDFLLSQQFHKIMEVLSSNDEVYSVVKNHINPNRTWILSPMIA